MKYQWNISFIFVLRQMRLYSYWYKCYFKPAKHLLPHKGLQVFKHNPVHQYMRGITYPWIFNAWIILFDISLQCRGRWLNLLVAALTITYLFFLIPKGKCHNENPPLNKIYTSQLFFLFLRNKSWPQSQNEFILSKAKWELNIDSCLFVLAFPVFPVARKLFRV